MLIILCNLPTIYILTFQVVAERAQHACEQRARSATHACEAKHRYEQQNGKNEPFKHKPSLLSKTLDGLTSRWMTCNVSCK